MAARGVQGEDGGEAVGCCQAGVQVRAFVEPVSGAVLRSGDQLSLGVGKCQFKHLEVGSCIASMGVNTPKRQVGGGTTHLCSTHSSVMISGGICESLVCVGVVVENHLVCCPQLLLCTELVCMSALAPVQQARQGISPPTPNTSVVHPCSSRQTVTKPDVRQRKTCLSSHLSGHAIFWHLEPGTGEGGLGKQGALGDAQGDGGWLPALRRRPRL